MATSTLTLDTRVLQTPTAQLHQVHICTRCYSLDTTGQLPTSTLGTIQGLTERWINSYSLPQRQKKMLLVSAKRSFVRIHFEPARDALTGSGDTELSPDPRPKFALRMANPNLKGKRSMMSGYLTFPGNFQHHCKLPGTQGLGTWAKWRCSECGQRWYSPGPGSWSRSGGPTWRWQRKARREASLEFKQREEQDGDS